MKEKEKQLNFDSCAELLFKIAEEKLHISKSDILSKAQTRILADTRRAIMRILKTKFPYTKVVVLGNLVNRDHSSVSAQLKKHQELISTKNDYSDLFYLLNDEFFKYPHQKTDSMDELMDIRDNLERQLNTVNLLIHELNKQST